MATYEELYDLRNNEPLKNKIAVAAVVAAEAKLSGTPTAAQATWARGVISSPSGTAKQLVNLVLAANKSLAVSVIQAASDSAIQSNVDAVIDGLIAGEV